MNNDYLNIYITTATVILLVSGRYFVEMHLNFAIFLIKKKRDKLLLNTIQVKPIKTCASLKFPDCIRNLRVKKEKKKEEGERKERTYCCNVSCKTSSNY